MKNFIYLLVLVVFISCSNDDDQPQTSQFDEEWYLVNAICFCWFEEELDFSEFKLSFKTSENQVHIENPEGPLYFIAETGIYDYSFQGDTLLIENAARVRFKYEEKDSFLILTYVDDPGIADDELVLRFQQE